MTKTKFLLQRAAGYLAGFALFYEPFMFFGRLTSSFLVETSFTSIHVPCARIPLANIVTGELQGSGPTSLFFCLLLAVISLWFGPLFCGSCITSACAVIWLGCCAYLKKESNDHEKVMDK